MTLINGKFINMAKKIKNLLQTETITFCINEIAFTMTSHFSQLLTIRTRAYVAITVWTLVTATVGPRLLAHTFTFLTLNWVCLFVWKREICVILFQKFDFLFLSKSYSLHHGIQVHKSDEYTTIFYHISVHNYRKPLGDTASHSFHVYQGIPR